MPASLRILIVGAGIAGPAPAHWLTRLPFPVSVTVVERAPVPRTTGQAIDIRGPAQRVMERAGLIEQLRAMHTTETGTRFVNARGQSIADFAGGSQRDFTAEFEILRADLSTLLMDKTRAHDDVAYRYGETVVALAQGESHVDVEFASGARETFDAVVAADGAASKTRRHFLDEKTLAPGYNFLGQYMAFFSIPRQPADTNVWTWYNAPRGLGVMTRPHRTPATMGAYLCLTTSAHGVEDPDCEAVLTQDVSAQKRLLRERFATAGWQTERVLDGMDGSSDFYMSKAAQIKTPKWTAGSCACLGDAAFATFGVGTSLAIEGAYVLAGELGKTLGDPARVPAALRAYEDIMHAQCDKTGDVPSIFPQLAMPQTAWGLRIRDSVIWAVGKTKVYKLLPTLEDNLKWELPEYEWAEERQAVSVAAAATATA